MSSVRIRRYNASFDAVTFNDVSLFFHREASVRVAAFVMITDCLRQFAYIGDAYDLLYSVDLFFCTGNAIISDYIESCYGYNVRR